MRAETTKIMTYSATKSTPPFILGFMRLTVNQIIGLYTNP